MVQTNCHFIVDLTFLNGISRNSGFGGFNNGRQGDIFIKATVSTVENLAQGVKEVVEWYLKILTEGINV